jgi:hypothetical protein
MTDLHDLLDVASRSATPDRRDAVHDFQAELRLGRRALRRRRITLAAGVTAAGLVVGGIVGGAVVLGPPPAVSPASSTATGTTEPTLSSTPTSSPSTSSISSTPAVMTERPAQSGPFRFGRTPSGWVAGASRPFVGTLVPVGGGVGSDATDLVGKITVMIGSRQTAADTLAYGSQGWTAEEPIMVGGRAMTIIVQVPESARVSDEDIDKFVDAITVSPEAEPAVS